MPGRRARSICRRRLQHRRGAAARRAPGSIATCSRPKGRCGSPRSPAPPSNRLIVRFRRNNWGQRDRALLLQLEAGQRDYEAFQGYTARLSAWSSRESTPIWQKRWTYAYGAEILATNESRDRRAPASRCRDAYFIGGLIGQIGYDRSNSLLDPTRGFRLLARVNPEASLRNGTELLRPQPDRRQRLLSGRREFVLAGRVRFGSIFGIARDDLAPSRRFYAGGGGSVRGFGFQELGPAS